MNPGDMLGPYRVEGKLGAGGMGEVYRAHDTTLNRPVAIKILPDTMAGDADLARFRREAESLAALNHPNIAQVTRDGQRFLHTVQSTTTTSLSVMLNVFDALKSRPGR